MKREIILFSTIFTLFTLVSCGGGDDGPGSINPPTVNTDPTAVSQLIYPSTDLLCIDNTITFQWSAASDADGDPGRDGQAGQGAGWECGEHAPENGG